MLNWTNRAIRKPHMTLLNDSRGCGSFGLRSLQAQVARFAGLPQFGSTNLVLSTLANVQEA